jgi:hypothetical protein
MSRQNEKRSRSSVVSAVHEAIADSPHVRQMPGNTNSTALLRSEPIQLRVWPRSLAARCVYIRAAMARKIEDG